MIRTVRARSETRSARVAGIAARAVEAFGAFPLTSDGLAAAADRRAGPDLLPEEVAEPLRRIAEDLARVPPTPLGRAILHTLLADGLTLRRRLQRAPTLPIRRPPIVVVGWYRSGTSTLQELLGALPGYGTVPLHRLLQPVRRRGSRIRAGAGIALTKRLAPELQVVHPVRPTGPEECWPILMSHLVVEGLSFHWGLPRFDAWLRGVDRGPAYRAWARALGLLEHDLGRGLVMKDPAHLLALPALLAAVPDARLVWTHRDPVECVASYASVTAVQHRLVTGLFDPVRAGRVSLERMARGIATGFATRDDAPVADVAYPALIDDPVGTVEQICEDLDLPFDHDAVAARAASLARPTHRYDLYAWGLDPAKVRERFTGYDAAFWTRGVRSSTGRSPR